MSIPVRIARFQGKDRQEIIQAVQKQMQEGALQAIRQVLSACLEAEVTVQLGREKGEPRRARSHARESDWKCGHCGCQDANFFTRDGQYHRNAGNRIRPPSRIAHSNGGVSTLPSRCDLSVCAPGEV